MTLGEIVVWVAGIYLAIGFPVGVAFAIAGVGRVDPVARGAPARFRVLIVPGSAALWPLIVTWWLTRRRTSETQA